MNPTVSTVREPTCQSLRFPEESDIDFRRRVQRTACFAKVLVESCLSNKCVKDYIADPDIPLYTEELLSHDPIVRVEYEQAIAIGGIGETFRATKSKSWGEGPFIQPLKPNDWFYPERITYIYRENSLFNRRFEQRQRMKELLGKHHRILVGTAMRKTKRIFLDNLSIDEAQSISRVFNVEPGLFWRAAKGKHFLDLPARFVQTEFHFEE